MAINKKGLLAGLAGLGLLTYGIVGLTKKKVNNDYEVEFEAEDDVEEDEVEDIDEA